VLYLGVRVVNEVVVCVDLVTTAHQKRSVTVRREGSVKVSASADDDWRQVVLVPVVVGRRGLPYGKREVVHFLFGKKVVSNLSKKK
jgi:hypothetical protein